MARQVRCDHPMCCYQVWDHSAQRAANSPGPCSRITGGPSPPSSTAEETPASCIRRSVTGRSANNRSRVLWSAERATTFVDVALTSHRRLPPSACELVDHDAKQRSGLLHREKHSSWPGSMRVIVQARRPRTAPQRSCRKTTAERAEG